MLARLFAFYLFSALSLLAATKWIEEPGQPAYALRTPPVKAASITLADGRTFADCSIFKETATTVTFRHAKGMIKVDKSLLPENLLASFPPDEEKAKQEAAANAEGLRQYEARKAEVAAKREEEGRKRLAEIEARKAMQRAAQIARKDRQDAAIADAVSNKETSQGIRSATGSDIEPAVRARAENYIRDGRRSGSGSTLVFNLRIELGDITAVAGWADRWSCEGVAYYNYYDSVWGGSFSSRETRFSCEVRRNANGRIEVTDFSPRS